MSPLTTMLAHTIAHAVEVGMVPPKATNTNTIEVPIKRAMSAAAQHPIALADSSKIGRRDLARVAGLDEVEALLTDSSVDADAVARYQPHLRVAGS